MRTWGTAMFSDDLASDIELEYRNKIGFGKSPVVATEEMINDYQHEINDGDESAVFLFGTCFYSMEYSSIWQKR